MKNTDFDFSTIYDLNTIEELERVIYHANLRIGELRPLHIVECDRPRIQKGLCTVGIAKLKIFPDNGLGVLISHKAYDVFREYGLTDDLVLLECSDGYRVYVTNSEAEMLKVDESEIVTK